MLLLAMIATAASVALASGRPPVRPRRRAAGRRRSVPVPLAAAASAAVVVLVLVPPPVGPPAALLAAVVTTRSVRRLEPAVVRRRRMLLEAGLPQVVDLMASALAAGESPSGALRRIAEVTTAPMSDELRPFAARLDLGADPVTVWASMAEHEQLGMLGRALLRATQTGASVADALGRLGEELRQRRRHALEAKARTVEVKASVPLGLCLLPAFVLVGIVPMVAGSFSMTFLGS